jgi:hypothetical protein
MVTDSEPTFSTENTEGHKCEQKQETLLYLTIQGI